MAITVFNAATVVQRSMPNPVSVAVVAVVGLEVRQWAIATSVTRHPLTLNE